MYTLHVSSHTYPHVLTSLAHNMWFVPTLGRVSKKNRGLSFPATSATTDSHFRPPISPLAFPSHFSPRISPLAFLPPDCSGLECSAKSKRQTCGCHLLFLRNPRHGACFDVGPTELLFGERKGTRRQKCNFGERSFLSV